MEALTETFTSNGISIAKKTTFNADGRLVRIYDWAEENSDNVTLATTHIWYIGSDKGNSYWTQAIKPKR